MNRTTSKRNEQLSWIVLALAFAAVIPNLPEIVVSALSDDYSKYSTFENLMSLVLGVLATVGLLYFFYTLFAIVIYSRALCLVDDKGIKVRYRLLLKKDKQFTWNDIEKVILATTASDKPELELRCFTKDFMTAEWTRIPYEVLDRVSVRIVNEVPRINWIVYDITSKPPATVEWE